MSVEIEDVEVIHHTDNAILCDIDGFGDVWIPNNHVTDDSEVWKTGQIGTLVITDWIAGKKGLD